MPDNAASASIMIMALSGARVATVPGATGDSSVVTTVMGAVGASDTACVGAIVATCVGASDTIYVGAGVLGPPTVNETALVSRSAIPSAIFASDIAV